MNYRSWLMVPGDSEDKLAEAAGSGADAIVVDLEDTVRPEAKPAARLLAVQWLQAHRRQIVEQRQVARWVRINGLDSSYWRDDLVAVMACAPEGIMLPKASGPDAVRQLAAEIYELEQRHQLANGSTRIMPLVGETARSAMTIAGYLDAQHQRLAGLTWGARDLAAAIGAARSHDPKHGWCDAFRFVRSQTLLAAHGCGVMAIDTAHADLTDRKGLTQVAAMSRADGFTGMLAIHPDQVAAINAAFAAVDAELVQTVLSVQSAATAEVPRGPILRPA